MPSIALPSIILPVLLGWRVVLAAPTPPHQIPAPPRQVPVPSRQVPPSLPGARPSRRFVSATPARPTAPTTPTPPAMTPLSLLVLPLWYLFVDPVDVYCVLLLQLPLPSGHREQFTRLLLAAAVHLLLGPGYPHTSIAKGPPRVFAPFSDGACDDEDGGDVADEVASDGDGEMTPRGKSAWSATRQDEEEWEEHFGVQLRKLRAEEVEREKEKAAAEEARRLAAGLAAADDDDDDDNVLDMPATVMKMRRESWCRRCNRPRRGEQRAVTAARVSSRGGPEIIVLPSAEGHHHHHHHYHYHYNTAESEDGSTHKQDSLPGPTQRVRARHTFLPGTDAVASQSTVPAQQNRHSQSAPWMAHSDPAYLMACRRVRRSETYRTEIDEGMAIALTRHTKDPAGIPTNREGREGKVREAVNGRRRKSIPDFCQTAAAE